ncbi:glycosyltransferase family 4 protein [Endozoicomonadaceae bacterium StTr2]
MADRFSGPVVLLLDSRGTGGIESHVLLLAKSLKQDGISPFVLFMKKYDQSHPMEDNLKSLDIDFEYLNGGLGQLRNKLRTAALVHTHGYKAGLSGRIAGRLAGIPVVSTFHNGDLGQGKMRIYTLLDRLTSFLSANIAVSEEIGSKLPFNRKVIPNFVDMPEPGVQSSGQAIGFVGRLSHEKGPDIFIELAKRVPSQPFIIFGDGSMRSELEAKAPENVCFRGMTRDMEQHWPQLGLLGITSRDEGLPLVALEAMSYGIPVLASQVGGLPQLINKEKNGWLAPAEDLEAFCRHIDAWRQTDAGQRKAMAENCITTVSSHYSCEALVPSILAIYRQALH